MLLTGCLRAGWGIRREKDEEWIKYAEISGKRFMMTHGHTFYIYTDAKITQVAMAEAQQRILDFMFKNNIDITLHGHIHESFLYQHRMSQSKNGWIFCPGRVGRMENYTGSIAPTYGVLKIKDSGALEWKVVEVEQDDYPKSNH